MLVGDMAALGGLITMDDLAQYQPKCAKSYVRNIRLNGHKLGSLIFAAAEFRRSRDDRSAEYVEKCPLEKLGRFRQRAHGRGNDAEGVRRSRCLPRLIPISLKCRLTIDQWLLRQRAGGDDRSQACVIEQSDSCGGTACLRRRKRATQRQSKSV